MTVAYIYSGSYFRMTHVHALRHEEISTCHDGRTNSKILYFSEDDPTVIQVSEESQHAILLQLLSLVGSLCKACSS